jgi:selenocysteine lyase/cysteine desulfurase
MNRRHLLTSSLLGFAAAGGDVKPRPLPDAGLRASDPEKFWLKVREDQFLLPGWRAFLNNGSLGVAPRPVLAAVEDYLETAAGLTLDEYPRWGYENLDEERAVMAAFSGCKKEELAFTHNATEALNFVVHGLDLKAGDEVVMTDHEHPSGKSPWQLRAKRHGITVREVPIPHPPKSPEQLADLMVSAIGPRTRVVSFSGIISPTGIIMPIREICRAARAKGVLTLVDGAHMHGQVPVDLHGLECDYFAGSPHKWLFAPAGCGVLYIREEHLARHWPTVATGGWDDLASGAARFMKVGTNNRAIFTGMMAGLAFHRSFGPGVVFDRIHQLAKLNYKMASQRPWLEMISPADDRMYGSLVTISFRGAKLDDLWRKARERKIWVYGSERLRISTHIHTRPADLDAFYALVDEVVKPQWEKKGAG